MNATLMVNSFTREEQEQLLKVLIDRLFPDSTSAESEAFPEWVMTELQSQDQRLKAGLETGDEIGVVEARLKAKLQSP